jgi:hypothetical protein
MPQEAPPVDAGSIPAARAPQPEPEKTSKVEKPEEPETFQEVLVASLPALIPLVHQYWPPAFTH